MRRDFILISFFSDYKLCQLPPSSPTCRADARSCLSLKLFLAATTLFTRVEFSRIDCCSTGEKDVELVAGNFSFVTNSFVCLLDTLEKMEGACTSFVIRKSNVYQPPAGPENPRLNSLLVSYSSTSLVLCNQVHCRGEYRFSRRKQDRQSSLVTRSRCYLLK